MKLISRNINGIRAGIKKGTFLNYLQIENPDIIGLQEVKAKFEQIEEKDIINIKNMGYEIYWNSAQKPGYSGTAVLSKKEAINVFYGIDTSNLNLGQIKIDEVIEKNHEGRVITIEYENFYFVNVYTPNSKAELERLDYRQMWDYVFLEYLKYLKIKKPIIFCGDLNVAHKEIDLANPSSNKTTLNRPGNAGFTNKERAGIQNYIDNGFIDTFRYFYPNKIGIYTWWSNFFGSRQKNIGWRIDYFLISQILSNNLKDAFIKPEILGSDHCPIGIEINIS